MIASGVVLLACAGWLAFVAWTGSEALASGLGATRSGLLQKSLVAFLVGGVIAIPASAVALLIFIVSMVGYVRGKRSNAIDVTEPQI